jgi:uncharacterized protein YgbK (DUF1537 family)
VTARQIRWAKAKGFRDVTLDSAALLAGTNFERTIQAAVNAAIRHLESNRSVIVHTGRRMPHAKSAKTAKILGSALGEVLRRVLVQRKIRRLCIAGGDTSSYAARALGIEAIEMLAPLTPGAPLCRAHAPGSPADGLEVVFKGGQVGAVDYFETVARGRVK